jgi:hypothetical protein
VAWSPRRFSPIEEKKRKSTLRRVQVEEGFGLRFLLEGRSERLGYSLAHKSRRICDACINAKKYHRYIWGFL